MNPQNIRNNFVRVGLQTWLVFLAVAGGAAVPPAMAQNTNLLANGSFEQPGFQFVPQNFRYLTGGDATLLSGWRLVHDALGEPSYAYHSSRYLTFDEGFAVALNDGDVLEQGPITIPASIPPGSLARISFYTSAPLTSLRADLGTVSRTFNLATDGSPTTIPAPGGGTWAQYTVEFNLPNPVPGDFTLRLTNLQASATFDTIPLDGVALESCLFVRTQPTPRRFCHEATLSLSVEAAASHAPIVYQWRRNGVPVAGGDTPTLALNRWDVQSTGTYDCLLINPAGACSLVTHAVEVALCVADVFDPQSPGGCDGGVTIDDLLHFLTLFEAGDIGADLDDGTSTARPDGGVTIDDLVYYLARFEAGC